MRDIRLGKFFYLSEFTRSEYAARHGIIIDPPPHIIEALKGLVVNVLDPLRSEIGPIHITSGYRPIKVNQAVGGSRTSQHVMGEAADFVSERMSVRQVFDTVRRMALPYDQVIEEFGRWTHVSYGLRNRRQALVARHEAGSVKYRPA